MKSKVRWSVLFIGAVATGIALSVGSIYALWLLSADLVYVILFPQLVMALYFRRATVQGALWGAGVGLFLRILATQPVLNLFNSWGLGMSDNFPFRTVAMLCSLATIAIVSLITYREPPEDETAEEGSAQGAPAT